MYLIKTLLFFLPELTVKVLNWSLLKFKRVEFSSYPRISGRLFLTGTGQLVLGQDVQFNSRRKSNPIGGDTRMIINLGLNGYLYIGDGTGISNSAVIAYEKIHIGRYVKIGGGTKLYDTDFHSLDPIKRKNPSTDIANTKPITIHDNVFIGAHSIILKGVTIGENSIIGAGSVVSKSVPPNEIWGGNPAKFIKKID